jgi:hypothetical protein
MKRKKQRWSQLRKKWQTPRAMRALRLRRLRPRWLRSIACMLVHRRQCFSSHWLFCRC